jgi:hypothetical protein
MLQIATPGGAFVCDGERRSSRLVPASGNGISVSFPASKPRAPRTPASCSSPFIWTRLPCGLYYSSVRVSRIGNGR